MRRSVSRRSLVVYGAINPTPPTGVVTARSPNPAMIGRARAMAACTAGSVGDAAWLASLSQTSVIQMALSSAGLWRRRS